MVSSRLHGRPLWNIMTGGLLPIVLQLALGLFVSLSRSEQFALYGVPENALPLLKILSVCPYRHHINCKHPYFDS